MGRKPKPNAMRTLSCKVPGCFSDARKNVEKHKFMENVEFYPFPTSKKNPTLRRKWLQMINRPADYDPKPWHRICSRHFVGGKLTENNNIPELFPSNNFKQPLVERPTTSIKKREILTPVKPSSNNRKTVSKGKDKGDDTLQNSSVTTKDRDDQLVYKGEFTIVKNVPLYGREIEVETEEAPVHTVYAVPEDHDYCLTSKQKQWPTYCDAATQTHPSLT